MSVTRQRGGRQGEFEVKYLVVMTTMYWGIERHAYSCGIAVTG